MAKGAVKTKGKAAKGEVEATALVLDFTNVKEMNFNSKHVPEGDYLGTITKIVKNKSGAGNAQWVVTIEGKGACKGGKYPYYCQLATEQLWKIRNLGVAAGLNVPKKKLNFDPKTLIGKEVGISLEDDEYEGKMRSKINGVMPPSEVTSDAPDATDDDEEVISGKSGGKKGKAGGKTKASPTPAKASKNGKGKKGKKGSSDNDLEEIDIEEI